MALLSALAACDTLDEYQEEVNREYYAYLLWRISELEGSWTGVCVDEAIPAYPIQSRQSVVIYRFEKRMMKTTFYSVAACAGEVMATEVKIREFLIEGPAEVDPTVKKKKRYLPLDSTNRITFNHADSVAAANTNAAYGRTDWAINAGKSIPFYRLLNGGSLLPVYAGYVANGWDMWARDYCRLSGGTLTLFDENTTNPETNQYPAAVTGGADYTR